MPCSFRLKKWQKSNWGGSLFCVEKAVKGLFFCRVFK